MSLEHLLRPKVIALVGASSKKASFGNFAAEALIRSQESAIVYFVNPKGEPILEKETYKSLADLPKVPDLVMLATNKNIVPALLTEAGEMGTKAAIVIAAGYSEGCNIEGKADEEVIAKIAEKYNIKVMGPNCTGFLNNIDKILPWATSGFDFDMKNRKTGAAIFAQSGTMATNAITSHLNISYVFSMGNSTFLSMEEVMEYVLEKERVDLLGIYLEGVKDPKRFINILRRAQELNKPVVIHAAGLSKIGARAAASHTGNLASTKAIYEAIFDKYNVIMVENQDQWISAMDVLSVWKDHMPKRANFSSMNTSGGETTLSADMCDKYGLNLPEFTPETTAKLRELLPEFGNPINPLDAVAGAGAEDADYLRVIGKDPNIDIILTGTRAFPKGAGRYASIASMFGITSDQYLDSAGKKLLDYLNEEDALPMAIMPTIEESRDERWRKILADKGVPILGTSDIGYYVMGRIAKYITNKNSNIQRTTEDAVPEKTHSGESIILTEFDSKQELIEIGLPMPKQGIAETMEKLSAMIEDFVYPLVLKISSPDILHKTDAGGVKLNIKTKEEALAAFDSIIENCSKYNYEAKLEGVLVQEMANSGVEMIIGISSDKKFGPILMVGMGGVFVEVFKDVAMYPCPFGKDEAFKMIESLKSYKLLKGYRGSKPRDIDALADVMVKLSEYAAKNKDLVKEIDLNPVFVYPEGEGVSIVDAVLIKYAD